LRGFLWCEDAESPRETERGAHLVISSKCARPSGDRQPAITHSAPEARANEQRARGARYASATPAPATACLGAAFEAAPVVVEVGRDAGFGVLRFANATGWPRARTA
jgi:hypothetical protein